MDDVSDFFKSGFLSLHKNAIGKNYQQRTLKDRMNNFNNMRRETRNTLMFQKRNIDENMTPINTPEPSKTVKKALEKKVEKKTNKRLEMLNKWKAEKEKRKQEEKQKTKPLFKVCHVPVEVGLPNLETVNKEIKGKPISQFAPPNHKFHAPKNVKPINFITNSNSLYNKVKSAQKIDLVKKTVSTPNFSVVQRNTRVKTRSQASEPIKVSKQQKTSSSQKHMREANTRNKNTSKQSQENNDKLNTKYENDGPYQQNIKQMQISQKYTTNKKTDITNKMGSLTSNSSTGVKCSPPKKSKKAEKLHIAKGVQTDLYPTLRHSKDSSSNKSRQIEKANGSKIATPSSEVRKLPKKNKIKFEEFNNRVDNGKLNKNKDTEGHKEILNKNLVKTPAETKKLSSMPKKNVGWNAIEIVDSDDELISKDIINKTPKTNPTKYKKTPRKGKKFSSNDTQESEIVGNEKIPELDSPATPKNKSENTDLPVYISPFVTVSRGKTSARKEYQVRQSTGSFPDTPVFNKSISNSTSPKAGAEYFSRKLNNEISRIEDRCREWNSYRDGNNIPEEANDIIDVAIGQSNLLISKKCQQFKSLIEQCKQCNDNNLNKPVTCEDLHGFWDMMYMQVEDLNKRFKNLDDLKTNNWKEVVPEKKPTVKRGRGRPKRAAATSSLKDLIKAARKQKKSNEDMNINQLLVPKLSDAKEFTGGYYSVKSPIRERNTSLQSPAICSSNARRSLRVSLLAHQTKNRMSSPGLTMMKISQAIKCGDGLTPSKSILKNDLTKSATRITKSVLFKDDLEEDIEENFNSIQSTSLIKSENKENNANEINLISFSPQTPTRRSRRLNKIN